MDGDEEKRRKRRDSLEDSQGAEIFTSEPVPPFISSAEDFIWCCFRADRDKAARLLPAGLHLSDPVTVHLAIYRRGPGWGLAHTTGGFLSLVIDGYASTDTAEAAFNLGGFWEAPDWQRMSRHFAPYAPGRSTFRREGSDIFHELWSDTGLVATVHSRLTDALPAEGASQDRYLGIGQGGDLLSYVVSSTGHGQACDLLDLAFGPAAPARYLALAPTELCWSLFIPLMILNHGAPEPLVRDTVPRAASLGAVLTALEGLGRAACIVSGEGRVLQRNKAAAELLGGTVAVGRGGAGGGPALVRRGEGRGPLILQLLPLSSDVAGADERLALLTDPTAEHRATPRVELLKLLNLTPAEARVASVVSSGLPPREAAARLGLAEATVRSTLKVVFGKLGVTRQAELVRLVGRLDPG